MSQAEQWGEKMEDRQIVELYWARSEDAIYQTALKYGKYCHQIAYQILSDKEDAKEIVNDTYYGAWNSIPPHKPAVLSAYLGKITRRSALNLWKKNHAAKRGGGEVMLALEELSECVASRELAESYAQRQELIHALNEFLAGLQETERRVFLCRYWYMDPIASVADRFGFSQSKIKSMLMRTRKKLLQYLKQEGLVYDE